MSENYRIAYYSSYISYKKWWSVGTAVAVIAGIAIYFLVGGPVTPSGMPRGHAVLLISGGLEAVVLAVWFACSFDGFPGVPIR